jgi:type 1 fimbriae regulatory protein FimB/type 1 fimbriae regulatory protein FimE
MSKGAPPCPLCKSKNVWKDGTRKTTHGRTQRFYCGNCGYSFSQTRPNSFNKSENVQKIHRMPLNIPPNLTSNRQICASQPTETKNLVKVETRIKNRLAGATYINTETKSHLFNFAWWMKKEGYAPTTITTRERLLRTLAKRGADLNDPESIKETIAKQNTWCNKRKMNAADAYTVYLRMHNKKWDPPRYKIAYKLPFIPTEKELDDLIAGCGPKTSTFLQLLKETGARCGEANKLKWTDLDLERGTIRITPEKGSKPRIFKLSNRLLSRLMSLKRNSEKIFCKHVVTQRRLFSKQRKNLARKLQNPRLMQIHFHTFRHWKATMEYHKTKDILHVMNILGHKNIMNTLKYTQLVDFKGDEYVSKATKQSKDACNLIENGFEYVCTTPDEIMLFRKRK